MHMNEVRGISGVRGVRLFQQATQKDAGGSSFGDMLSKFLDDVNALQKQAGEVTQKAITGEIQDVHQVTIAAQKAAISLQLTAEIRNRIMESYQEIIRMQV